MIEYDPQADKPPEIVKVSTEYPSKKDAQTAADQKALLSTVLGNSFFNPRNTYNLAFGNNAEVSIVLPRDNYSVREDLPLSQLSFTGSVDVDPAGVFAKTAGNGSAGYASADIDPFKALTDSVFLKPELLQSILQELKINHLGWAIVPQGGGVFQHYQVGADGFHATADINPGSTRFKFGGEFIENIVKRAAGDNFARTSLYVTNDGAGWKYRSAAAFEAGQFALHVGSRVEDYFPIAKNGRLLHNTMFSGQDGADVFGTNVHVASYDYEKLPGLIASEFKFGRNCNIVLANDSQSKTNLLAANGLLGLEGFLGLGVPLQLDVQGAYIQQRDIFDRLNQGVGGNIQIFRVKEKNAISLFLGARGTKNEADAILIVPSRENWTGEIWTGVDWRR